MKVILLRLITNIVSNLLYIIHLVKWKKPAKPNKIIWVSPDQIKYSLEFTPIVKYRLYYLNGVVSGGEWGYTNYKVEILHSELLEAFKLHFKLGKSFQETPYFQKMEISESEKAKRIDYYQNKYQKIYKQISEGSGFKKPGSLVDRVDPFKVSISAKGEILFMTGKHRLAITKLMGTGYTFPVFVSFRHSEWQKYRDNLYVKLKEGEITPKEIKELKHPDLFDLVEGD